MIDIVFSLFKNMGNYSLYFRHPPLLFLISYSARSSCVLSPLPRVFPRISNVGPKLFFITEKTSGTAPSEYTSRSTLVSPFVHRPPSAVCIYVCVKREKENMNMTLRKENFLTLLAHVVIIVCSEIVQTTPFPFHSPSKRLAIC